MKTPGKNTQIIVSFLMLSLICNLECRKMTGPSMNILKKIEKCDSTEGHAVKVDKYRINRYNQTVYTYDGNIELQTELTNEDSEMNIMAEKWGNGGWKRTLQKRFPNACSSAEKFAPNYIQSIMKQANVTGCPVPVGPSMNILKKVEKCNSTEGHAAKIDKYRINRYNQTVYTYNGNIEIQTELRDEDTEVNIMMESRVNGGWKRNFLRRIPNACSSAEKFAPNYVQSIMKQANITGCPIPAGNYEIKDLVINVDVAIPIPYGLYRSQVDLLKNGTISVCEQTMNFRVT
ncbi:uncharacterized protein isoform X2 [Rhodnius prolixus]|uniref:uncharacterized protein isoform X2 n=1 Tax=Rhodnius prolixus TaxID=13249 RepID=UPI003D18A351